MKVLWVVTAGVAVILLVITLIMAMKVQGGSSDNFTGTIKDQGTSVYLRDRPEESGRTLAIVDPGTEVYVDRSTTRGDITWYHITTDSGSGWIPETDLSLSRP